MSDRNILTRRVVRRGLAGHLFIGMLVFGSARTFHFWQGWALIILQLTAGTWIGVYFLKHDPELLGRRLILKERVFQQRIIVLLWRIVGGAALVLAGDDYRCGWSRRVVGLVPVWLECLAWLVILGGDVLLFEVMKANSFAASVIQIETTQSVIATGPYRIVRHPMYVAFLAIGLVAPLALGSYIAAGLALLIIPLVVIRLLNEEKMLHRDLTGYTEYCGQTRFRLIPFVW
jgi:protein-S-isoprenylcysteine O-methyltransferase Ste14